MDLLELFLQQKGWDLLNHWFLDSINSANWFLCGDLVKLFAVCPMNPARLKENVEVNQAPKLIRQLSSDQRLDAGIKSEAAQVLQQWMSVIRAPPTQQKPPPAPSPRVTASPEKPPVSPTDAGALHGSDDDWQPEEEKSKPLSKKISMMKKKELDRNSATDSSVDVDDLLGGDTSSEDEDENCAIKKKKEEIERRRQEREEKKMKEEEREKKKAQERKEKSKLGYSKSELGNRGSMNTAEKERIKEVAKKLKQEAEQKGKGKVETSSKQESPRSTEAAPPAIERKSSITAGLGRIPKKEKPKEAAPSFSDLLGGLDVQKPKTIIKNKNKDLMDSLLNTSGGSPNKSSRKEERDAERRKEERKRSRDSLESRAREKEDRLKEKEEKSNKEKEEARNREKEEARSREKEERHKQKEERRSSLTGKESSKDEEKSSKEKEKSRERSSKSEERNGGKEGTLKVRPHLTIPTEKERRSKEKETSPVTTPEAKKSPKVIKESNMFMDVLGDIMKETPKKKKRRLSEVKAEREAKEEAAKKLKKDQDEEEANKQSASSGSDEEKSEETSAMDEDDLPFAEPLRELPREVRGILVLAKGKKVKRSIQWRPESSLVEVKLFELDEEERANVFKLKSFEEMRKQELAREKQAGTGMKGSQMEDEERREEKEEKNWRLKPIAFQDTEHEAQVEKIWACYGKDSQEKEVQLEREGRVLKSLFFNSLPTDPAEPDLVDRGGDPRAVVKDIPGDDQSCEGGESADSVVDHSTDGWPTPMDKEPTFDSILRGGQNTSQGPVPAAPQGGLPANISAMLTQLQDPALQSILGQNVNTPPPTLKPEEAELYQSQIAAATALAQNGDLAPPLHLPPPNFNQGYDGPRGGYQNHNNHMDRPPPGFDGHNNRGHHNNFNKNRSQSVGDRWGREDRGGFKANNFRKDARRDDRRGGGFKRPCKFWMDKGRCKAEDSCLYPHPR